MGIVESMARTLFVTNWADRCEENGQTFPGCELMDIAPSTSDDALHQAYRLMGMIEALNGGSMICLLARVCHQDDELPDAHDWVNQFKLKEDFGHYLVMEALGHGVSWSDDHDDHGLTIPGFEYWDDIAMEENDE